MIDRDRDKHEQKAHQQRSKRFWAQGFAATKNLPVGFGLTGLRLELADGRIGQPSKLRTKSLANMVLAFAQKHLCCAN